jgi:hypothetical protein
MPFIAFTPVFLILTGYVLLEELPSPIKLMGATFVVIGSMVISRLFAVGWAESITATLREPGSRYMLCMAFIFSIRLKRAGIVLVVLLVVGLARLQVT